VTKDEMKTRTKSFAVKVIKFTESLPRSRSVDIISRQIIRSSTSVGANYRAALNAKSPPDFISKIGIVLEEVDESLYWIEILLDIGATSKNNAGVLLKEADELTAIFAATLKTARSHLNQKGRELSKSQ